MPYFLDILIFLDRILYPSVNRICRNRQVALSSNRKEGEEETSRSPFFLTSIAYSGDQDFSLVFLRYYGKLYFSFIKNLLSPCEMLIGILLEENYEKRSFVERDFVLFF